MKLSIWFGILKYGILKDWPTEKPHSLHGGFYTAFRNVTPGSGTKKLTPVVKILHCTLNLINYSFVVIL